MANRRRPVVPAVSGPGTAVDSKTGSGDDSPTPSTEATGATKTDTASSAASATSDPAPGGKAAATADKKAEEKAEAKAQKKAEKAAAKAGRKRSSGAPLAERMAAIKRPAKAPEKGAAKDTAKGAAKGTAIAAARPVGSSSRTRTARLRLVHVDPWSVMKTAFLLSIALGIVMIVAVAIVWGIMGAAGVWDSINSSVQKTVGSDSAEPFNITDYIGAGRVIGFTMVAAVLDVVVLTALATLGAFVYNLAATLLGGVEMTLAEDR